MGAPDDAPAGRARRRPDGRLEYRPRTGDVVVLRSAHVCGADRMVVTQAGLDIRLACSGCGARVVLSRERLRSRVRDVVGTVRDGDL